MLKTVKARFWQGQIEFLEKPDIPEGAEITVSFEEKETKERIWQPIIRKVYDRTQDSLYKIEGYYSSEAPDDLAVNHDKYIYED
ncbi:MAG: hypothetical protein L3V56_11900 [Candidatus Magnetoovum sp. WYHC-5]|nr:hypothetical protein [Candidatus Magnetoovum sp. WYHC-5]